MAKKAAVTSQASRRFLFGFEAEGRYDSMWVPANDPESAQEELERRLERRYPVESLSSFNLLQEAAR